jgi:hypothetical protein
MPAPNPEILTEYFEVGISCPYFLKNLIGRTDACINKYLSRTEEY